MDSLIILAFITLLGILSKNKAVWVAAATLLFIKTLFPQSWLQWLESNGLSFGVIILTIGVLSPIAVGHITSADLFQTGKSIQGILAVIVGILVAYLGGKGALLLTSQPQIITGLLVGTILGVAIFRGVPVGPLIAAGILAVLIGEGK